TWAAWLYDLLKPHVTEVVVCNPRKNGKTDPIAQEDLGAPEIKSRLRVRGKQTALSHARLI
ncbi:MAG TPA: hypothetical protein VN920_16980, partial [Pyrinomonadaceae bacterium]|nr:hypothetical protein [Pyrinomonadaceae bacterium]